MNKPADLLFETAELSPEPAKQTPTLVLVSENLNLTDAIDVTPPGMPLCPPFNNSVPNSPAESVSEERQHHTLPTFFRSRSAPVSPRNRAEPHQPRFQTKLL